MFFFFFHFCSFFCILPFYIFQSSSMQKRLRPSVASSQNGIQDSFISVMLLARRTDLDVEHPQSAPGAPLRPRRDSTIAQAAQQPSMLPQRRRHAVSALLRSTSGASRDLAQDNAVKNLRVSDDTQDKQTTSSMPRPWWLSLPWRSRPS